MTTGQKASRANQLPESYWEPFVTHGVDKYLVERLQSGVFGTRDVIVCELQRYYWLLNRERRLLALPPGEAQGLVDLIRAIWQPFALNDHWWDEVVDALGRRELAEQWGFDGVALGQRVREMSPARRLALLDAIERCWLAVNCDPSVDRTKALERVGLIQGEAAGVDRSDE